MFAIDAEGGDLKHRTIPATMIEDDDISNTVF